jgi:uncharacterized protein (DUF302 family)
MFEDRYTFGTRIDGTLAGGFDAVLEAVTEALRTEGFGVLTEIDVAATMRAKLGVELDPYRILGACNPPFAHRALVADPSVGALLPCNVVVRVDGGDVVVEAMDPRAVLALVAMPGVDDVAVQVRERLVRAVEVVGAQFDNTESPR